MNYTNTSLSPAAALSKDRSAGKSEMQHRHFATIATCLVNMKATRAVCEQWADELAPTNPRFERARFLKTCGY